jgi:glycosyltransferase involved in cell wall biosynthesis
VKTVSVIIPVFNRPNVLGRAVESVLFQTFEDFELIVVDDGSTQPIAEVIAEALQRPNVHLLHHETNRGAAAARNTGVRTAEGRYVAFLDSDDRWHREKLARQVAFMQSDADCRASCTGFALVSNGKVFDRRLPPIVNDLDGILWGCRTSPGTTLMMDRTLYEAAGPMDETLGRLEDWDWMLLAASHAPFKGLREVLADVQHNRYAHVDDAKLVAAADKMVHYVRDGRYKITRAQRRVLLSALNYELAANYYRKAHFGRALVALGKSFLYCPWKRPGHALSALNTIVSDIKRFFKQEDNST